MLLLLPASLSDAAIRNDMKVIHQNIILAFISSLLTMSLCAQVDINRQITMDTLADSRIRNIGETVDAHDGISVITLQSGKLVSGVISGSDSSNISTNFFCDTLSNGALFRVFLADSLTGDSIYFNNTGPFLLLRGDGKKIRQEDFPAGRITWLLFADSAFFIQSGIGRNGCPPGFIAPTDEYCIQKNENPLNTYWAGQQYCESLGARMCTWGEWYYACQNPALGMLGTINNWEWIDGAQNHTNAGTQLGNAACTSNQSVNVFGGTTAAIRCCYTR